MSMETAGLSESTTELLRDYLQTRLPWRVFVPLAVFLWGSAALSGGARGPLAIALAWAMLGLLRLQDDLASRVEDSLLDPHRVTIRAQGAEPFVPAWVLCDWTCFYWIALTTSDVMLFLFVAFRLTAFLWYAVFHATCTNLLLRGHVVLLKYPAFVFFLADLSWPDLNRRFGGTLLLVYLTFCVYEILHDSRVRATTGAFLTLAVELALMVTIGLGLATHPLHLFVLVPGAMLLFWLLVGHGRKPFTSMWSYTVFAVTGSWLLGFAFIPMNTPGAP